MFIKSYSQSLASKQTSMQRAQHMLVTYQVEQSSQLIVMTVLYLLLIIPEVC